MARGALTPLTLSRGPAADNEPASSASYVHTSLTRVNTFKLANKDAAAHTSSSLKHGRAAVRTRSDASSPLGRFSSVFSSATACEMTRED